MNLEYRLRMVRSFFAKLIIRASYRNVRIGRGAIIGANAVIRAFDGGTVTIGEHVDIWPGVTIEAKGGHIVIGNDVLIGQGSMIAAAESVIIGNDALIAEHVTIRDQNHATTTRPYRLAGSTADPVVIGDNVWIGAKACVLKGVTLPTNTIVGAGAVVTRSPAETCTLVGAPAKPLRHG